MEIGRRLRELRETKHLSQGDIEKKTGLLRCYTSRVENGYTVRPLTHSRNTHGPSRSLSTVSLPMAKR